MKLFMIFLAGVAAYMNGVDTCADTPNHGRWAPGCSNSACVYPAGSMPPFIIDVRNSMNMPVTSYLPSTNYSVVLRTSANSTVACTASNCFRGWVMNSGSSGSTFSTVSASPKGSLLPGDTNSRRMTGCPNGITHSTNSYMRSIRAIWMSPPAGSVSTTFKSVIVSTAAGNNYVATNTLPEFNGVAVSPSSSPAAMSTRTPIPPTCFFPPPSISGTWVGATNGSGATGGLGGTCGGVTYSALTGENIVVVSVPSSAVPGGSLTVDTCTGTSWDTELIISNALVGGCPASSAAFTCAGANDDSCGLQSRVSIPATPGSSYAVLVTGFGAASGAYTLNWNYGAALSPQASPSPSRTQMGSRSGSPTTILTPSSSFTPQPSISSTPSSSSMPTGSATSSGIGSSTPSVSPAGSATSSQSMSASITSSPDPSFSSSFTMRASQSSTPSMAESASMSDTHTETSSASNTRSPSFSMTAYPSRTPLLAAAGGSATSEASYIGYASISFGVGIIAALIPVAVYYVYNKRNKARRSVHLSPQIYFNTAPAQPTTSVINSSFRANGAPKGKAEFEPVSIEY